MGMTVPCQLLSEAEDLRSNETAATPMAAWGTAVKEVLTYRRLGRWESTTSIGRQAVRVARFEPPVPVVKGATPWTLESLMNT
jgi:hypothetical protein